MNEEPFQEDESREEGGQSYQEPQEQGPPQQEQREWSQGPSQQQQPPQQQRSQQQYKKRDFLEDKTSNSWLAKMVLLGLIFILVGMLLTHAAPFQTNYGSDPPDSDDQQDNEATRNSMIYTGNILKDIGVFMISVFFLAAAFYRDDWNRWLRIAIILFTLVLIIFAWFGGVTLGLNLSSNGFSMP